MNTLVNRIGFFFVVGCLVAILNSCNTEESVNAIIVVTQQQTGLNGEALPSVLVEGASVRVFLDLSNASFEEHNLTTNQNGEAFFE